MHAGEKATQSAVLGGHLVWIGAAVTEQPGGLLVVPSRRHPQRGQTVLVGLIDWGARVEQRANGLRRPALEHGLVQVLRGRRAPSAHSISVSAGSAKFSARPRQ